MNKKQKIQAIKDLAIAKHKIDFILDELTEDELRLLWYKIKEKLTLKGKLLNMVNLGPGIEP